MLRNVNMVDRHFGLISKQIQIVREAHRIQQASLHQPLEGLVTIVIDGWGNTILHILAERLRSFLHYPDKIEGYLQIIEEYLLKQRCNFLHLNHQKRSFMSIILDLTREPQYETYLRPFLEKHLAQWTQAYPALLQNPFTQTSWWHYLDSTPNPLLSLDLLLKAGQNPQEPLDSNGNTILHKLAEWTVENPSAKAYLDQYEQAYSHLQCIQNQKGETYLHVLVNVNQDPYRRVEPLDNLYATNAVPESLWIANAHHLIPFEVALRLNKNKMVLSLIATHARYPEFCRIKGDGTKDNYLSIFINPENFMDQFSENDAESHPRYDQQWSFISESMQLPSKLIPDAWRQLMNRRPFQLREVINLARLDCDVREVIDEENNTALHVLLADSEDTTHILHNLVLSYADKGNSIKDLFFVLNRESLMPIEYALNAPMVNFKNIMWLLNSKFITVFDRFFVENTTLLHLLARWGHRSIEVTDFADTLLTKLTPPASAKWKSEPLGYFWSGNYWRDEGVALMPIAEALKQERPHYLYAFKMIERGSPAHAKVGNEYLLHHLVTLNQEEYWIKAAIHILIKHYKISPNAKSAQFPNKIALQYLFSQPFSSENLRYKRAMLLIKLGASPHHALDDEGNTLLHRMAVAATGGEVTIRQLQKLIERDMRCVFNRNNTKEKALSLVTQMELSQNALTEAVLKLLNDYDRPDAIMYPHHINHIPYSFYLGVWGFIIPLMLLNATAEGHVSIMEEIKLPFWMCVILNMLLIETPIIYERIKKDYFHIQLRIGYANPENQLLRAKLALTRYKEMFFTIIKNRILGLNYPNVHWFYKGVALAHFILHGLTFYNSIYDAPDGLPAPLSAILGVIGGSTLSIACNYTTSEDFFKHFDRSHHVALSQPSSRYPVISPELAEPLLGHSGAYARNFHEEGAHPHLPWGFDFLSGIFAALSGLAYACILTHFMGLFYAEESGFKEEESHFDIHKPLDDITVGILILSFLVSAIYNQGSLRKNAAEAVYTPLKLVWNKLHSHENLNLRLVPTLSSSITLLTLGGIGYVLYNLAHHTTHNMVHWSDILPTDLLNYLVLGVSLIFMIQTSLSLATESVERSYQFTAENEEGIKNFFLSAYRKLERIPVHMRRGFGFFSAPSLKDPIEVDYQEIELENRVKGNEEPKPYTIEKVISQLKRFQP